MCARSHLVEEGGARQHHGELAGVVGVVQPRLVVEIPGVEPPREAHDAVPGLAPHPGGGWGGETTLKWIKSFQGYITTEKQVKNKHSCVIWVRGRTR